MKSVKIHKRLAFALRVTITGNESQMAYRMCLFFRLSEYANIPLVRKTITHLSMATMNGVLAYVSTKSHLINS